MITLKDFMEAVSYRITEGSDYGWQCFGPNARYLDCQGSEVNQDYSVSCVFDSKDQTVYSVEAWDYRNNREYRWIHPDFQEAFNKEAKQRELDPKESFDGNKYIEIEVVGDILGKTRAIVNGEEYDDRIQIEIELEDDIMLQCMLAAHKRDITFNQLVEEILIAKIAELKGNK